MVEVPQDCDPETRAFAQKVVQGIIHRLSLDTGSTDWKVEIVTSVVHSRVYIGAMNEELDQYYTIQIDKA